MEFGLRQTIADEYAIRDDTILETVRKRMRYQLMGEVSEHLGTHIHTIQLSERVFPDHALRATVYQMGCVINPVEHIKMRMYDFEPLPLTVNARDVRERCHYCGGLTYNDTRGNCSACGAPRR